MMVSLDGEILELGMTCSPREFIRVELEALVLGVHPSMSI